MTAPSGQRWRVRRLWAPRLTRFGLMDRIRRSSRLSRRAAGELGDTDPGCAVDLAIDASVAVVALAVLAVLVFLATPLLLVVVDLAVAVVLTVLGIAGRLLFRRPWLVEASSDAGERHRWRVVGWRRSREHAADVANALTHGNLLPGDAVSATDGVAHGGP